MNYLSIFSGRRVIVTGHTGFKGSWLSLWLAKLGAQVHGISLDVPSKPSQFEAANLSSLVKDYRLDIRDTEELKLLFKTIQPDFIFHLAAQALVRRSYANPVDTWQTNTLGTINILEAMRNLQHPCVAVIITSDKCYDNVEWVWGYRETDALGGPDPYSASKGAAELAIRSYVKSFFPVEGSVRIGVARAGNVIGGGDWAEDRIVPDCMRAWSEKRKVSLRNSLSTRPWQHVLEPLSGYLSLAIALKGNPTLHGETFNFGPPAQQNHSVGELVGLMARHWGRAYWEDASDKFGGPHEANLLKLNCDKALHYLKWWAVWDFAETVRETVVWYQKYYEQPTKSIADVSLKQIGDYQHSAKSKGVSWAQ
jgi:CDP-glucose 4,6-dehydratase